MGKNPSSYIDNRNHEYCVKYLTLSNCGYSNEGAKCRVYVRPDVLDQFPNALEVLSFDVSQTISSLPTSVHNLVKRTIVWVNSSYRNGPVHEPNELMHSTAHHDEEWLKSMFDNPDKCHGIEIYNYSEYAKNRLHWNGNLFYFYAAKFSP